MRDESGFGGGDAVAELLAELHATADAPFDRARAMPAGLYTSEAVCAREIARVFRRDWVCVGRAGALPETGDYLTVDLGGEPVIVLRDGAGRLRAFSNVCRHRMSLLLEGRGNAQRIVCPYHAWTYGLDGALRGAPAMTGNAGFRRGEISLPEFRCETWLGFVMVTLDPNAEPVAERLAELSDMVAPFGLDGYGETFREERIWDTNWKALAENFMESYHIPVCHAATVGPQSRFEEMRCPPGRPGFNVHWILKDDAVEIALAHPENTRLDGDWRRTTGLFTIYPSLLLALAPGYFWYLSLHPDGPSRVRILYGGGLAPDFAADPCAAEHAAALKTMLDAVNAEDKGCIERVYRGLRAGFAAPGPLSHLERPNHDFARYLADRLC